MVTNVTKEWLLGESGTDGANANVGITGVGSGSPKYHSIPKETLSASTFPTGHIIQTVYASNTPHSQSTATQYLYDNDVSNTSTTGTPLLSITTKQDNTLLMVTLDYHYEGGSFTTNGFVRLKSYIRYSSNNDLSSATEVQVHNIMYDTRSGGDLPGQIFNNIHVLRPLQLSNNKNDVLYFGVKIEPSSANMGTDNFDGTIPVVLKIEEIAL